MNKGQNDVPCEVPSTFRASALTALHFDMPGLLPLVAGNARAARG
jgi:hypothetical protein